MFLNLHCHSVYSKCDAMSEPIDVARINKEMGNDAFALTEHGDLGSWIQAYLASKETGLQFIPGCEFYLVPEDKYWAWNVKNNDEIEPVEFACKYHHLICLAKNQTGVQSLINIYNTHEEYYGKPCITRENLFKNSDGLIVMSACVAGEVIYYISHNMRDKAKEIMQLYKDKFGEDYYAEIQFHYLTDVNGMSELEVYNTLVELARELDIEMVPTTDSHFNYKEDANDHNVYKALYDFGGKVAPYDYENKSFKKIFDGHGYYIMNEEELRGYISNITALSAEDIDHIVENSIVVRNKCEETHFPEAIKLKDKLSELRGYVEQGWKDMREGTEYEQESRERLEYELSTIEELGFSEYFINVRSIVKRARMLGILVGGARGCFLPGNSVTLEGCCKNIENVVAGDSALTKSGGFKPVIGTHKYEIDEDCIELTLSNGEKIRCTQDHEIFVGGEWVEAKDLKIGDKLNNPKIRN